MLERFLPEHVERPAPRTAATQPALFPMPQYPQPQPAELAPEPAPAATEALPAPPPL